MQMLPHDLQEMIETEYSRHHVRTLIKEELKDTLMEPIYECIGRIQSWIKEEHYETKKNSLEYLNDNVNWEELLIDVLAVIIPATKTTLTSIVGQTAHLLPIKYEIAVKRMSEILYQMAVADLIEMTPAHDSDEGVIIIENVYCLSDKLLHHLNKVRFVPPMVCEPRTVKHNKDSGYLTFRSPIMSKSYNQHEGDLCLDVMNLTNKCAFSLDIDFLKAAKDTLVDESLNQMTNETCVDLFHWGNKFYFNNFYDARGRMYCRGFHLNYQGNSYRKAMLNFHKTEEIKVDEEYEGIF